MNNTLIASIDLGTTKVVCLVGEKTLYGIKIIALSQSPSKGIMRGEVVNIQHALDSIIPVLRDVENSIGRKINEVFVGIAGQNIRCTSNGFQTNRKNPEDLITKQEIEEIRNGMFNSFFQSDEEVLHVIPQSYNIDDFMGISDPIGMPGKQICANFKLFIGKKNSALYTNNVIKRAGLKLRELILEPLASAKAVLSEDELELGVAMVDIGGGTTDLLIVHDNIIRHTAVIPFGGNSITEDIKMGCGISAKQAELLKIEHGSCYSAYAPDGKSIFIPGIGGREGREISFKLLANIIEARVAELLEAVDYEIERSGYKNLLKGGIVLTGGSSSLANIIQLTHIVTGMDARIAMPNDSIAQDSLDDVFKPALSTAVGLVIMGFEKMESDGVNYNTTTAIVKEEEKEIVEQEDNTLDQNKKSEKVKEEKAPKEKKQGFKLKNFFKSFETETMFKDNEA